MRAPSKLPFIWRSCAAALLLCAAGAVQAQTSDTAGDPPDRVARLSWLGGDVGLLPSGAHDWGEAGINRPLTTGDQLASAPGARAELELGGAAIRLDGQTDVGLLELDDRIAQLELTQGTLNLTVRQLDDGQSYEIDTPAVALVVDHPGSFRVDVERDGQATRVTAFDGSATVYGENDARRQVVAGRSYRFADSSLAQVTLEDIAGGDDFDAWCDQRERRYADATSGRYVSDDVIGYQDLDDYGDWRSDPDYGTVWYPAHVDADWAPYRDGHWAWVGPWGWTWVDDEPWGFAPYHYGRWAWRNGWCWVPGPRTGLRPVYAPALVAFVGGRHWGAALGQAPVGWFPLGPGEVYDPWYRGSRRYYTQVNVTNIRLHHGDRAGIADRIDRHYRDWHRGIAPPVRALRGGGPRGFTAVPARDFADAMRVQRHRLRIDPRKLAGATLLTRAATPRPTPRSFAPQRPPHAQPLPAQGFRRGVVAWHAPRSDAAARVAQVEPHASAPGNVRQLDRHARMLPAIAHLAPARPDRAGAVEAERQAPARFASSRAARSANAPARVAPHEAPLRRGELRSARFVHARDAAGEPDRTRPGVSFISSAQADREQAARTGAGLPQVPHIERADRPRAPSGRARVVTSPRYRPAPMTGAHDGTPAARPAHMRAPDFSQWRTRPAAPAPRFQRPTEFRSIRPTPQAAPRAAPHAAPNRRQAPAAHPQAQPPRRFDPHH